MEDKDIFRTAIFGGYQKEDVTDYIRSLENENETIRILANKEKSELRSQLEKEKARSEALKHSLASLQDRIAALEKEGKLRESAGEPEASYTSDAKNRTTDEELMDYLAIGQCTPGLIAINTATFIGEKRKGVIGGIVATLGFVTPALITIMIVAALLQNFADYPAVQNAFAGIRVCVCVLILNAVLKLWKKSVTDKITLLIFAAVFLLTVFTAVSPAVLVIVSGVAGIFIKQFTEGRDR